MERKWPESKFTVGSQGKGFGDNLDMIAIGSLYHQIHYILDIHSWNKIVWHFPEKP